MSTHLTLVRFIYGILSRRTQYEETLNSSSQQSFLLGGTQYAPDNARQEMSGLYERHRSHRRTVGGVTEARDDDSCGVKVS